jgi:hypothetical protein
MIVMTRKQVVAGIATFAALTPLLLTACTNAAATGAETSSSATHTPALKPSVSGPPTSTALFTSAIYSYSVAYPVGWTVTPATTAWVFGRNDPDQAGVSDVFRSPGKPLIQIAVQQIPAGMSAAAWKSQILPRPVPTQMAVCFPQPGKWAPVTIGGTVGIGQHGYVIKGVVDPGNLSVDTFNIGFLNTMFAALKPPGTTTSS